MRNTDSGRMHKPLLLIFTLLFFNGACHAEQPGDRPERILFVGNSQLYVGNVPAVFSALAAANGQVVTSDMIVRGGATLGDRVADGSVERALATNRYTKLVLQERGGNLICVFGSSLCTESKKMVRELANAAREHGVETILLGTYQPVPSVSRELIEGESRAAKRAGIPYVEVSDRLQRLRNAAPELEWFYSDGIHPGKDLVLLDAILLYRQFFGSYPEAKSFSVKAPIYAASSGLTERLRAANTAAPNANTPIGITYPASTISTLLAIIAKQDR